MPKYIGQPCTSCRSVFKEGDDIVVCPVCGSPYHRDCYANEGKCVNTILHEAGRDWEPEADAAFSAGSSAEAEKVCPNCGTKNPAGNLFCLNCGSSLSQSERAEEKTDNPGGSFRNAQNGSPYGLPPFVNVSTVAADSDVDGNTVGDYSKYVGSKFFYYIPKFMRFAKTKSKLSLNFSAFFFPYLWFAYRKMPAYAIVLWLVNTVAAIPAIAMYSSEMLGITIPFLETTGFIVLYNILYILDRVLRILCAAFGNYLYYKKAKADICRIKENFTEETSRSNEIAAAGGVSMAGIWIFVGLTFAVSMVISAVLAPIAAPM